MSVNTLDVREETSNAVISREEIIKKFDLPERKTKIDTILKLQKEQEQEIYCICQSTDATKFMIGCDKCDEWYHGDCIGMNEKFSQLIKKWYCSDCVQKYGLKVEYFPHCVNNSSHKKKQKKHKHREKYPYMRTGFSCGRCSNCLQNEECGNKDYLMLQKRTISYPRDEQNEFQTYPAINAAENWTRQIQERVSRIQERRQLVGIKVKECIAPNCTNINRVNSKYCSDECGFAFAKLRIFSIIPHHYTEYHKFRSIADCIDEARLEEVRVQKKVVQEELQRLDEKEKKLMELIERVKKVPVAETEEEIKDDSKSSCVSCGWEVQSRSIIKHMESCFRKFETQTIVESLTRSNSDCCHIFCDYYNEAKRTYCMRLRYICPDHFKPRKAEDNEVCGCPVVKLLSLNIFSEVERICQRPKKDCSQHYNWEIIAISDIDLERQREFYKLNLLIRQEDNILQQISNRKSVAGLLLHSTIMNRSSI